MTSTVILTTLGDLCRLSSSFRRLASKSSASPIVITPVLASGTGGILKLVNSLGVDGRREVGRGERRPGVGSGVSGWFGGVEMNDDRTGFTLIVSSSLQGSMRHTGWDWLE